MAGGAIDVERQAVTDAANAEAATAKDKADAEPAEKGAGTDDKPAQVTVNKWQLLALLAVMVTLVAVIVAGFAFKGDTDSVTGIIGAALPPFATIAAAIFGIKAVYDSGKATGEATGKAEAEKGKDEAVTAAKDKTARAITEPLRHTEPNALSELVTRVRRAGQSPYGASGYQLLGPDPTQHIDLSDELLTNAERPSHEVQMALAIAEQYMRR